MKWSLWGSTVRVQARNQVFLRVGVYFADSKKTGFSRKIERLLINELGPWIRFNQLLENSKGLGAYHPLTIDEESRCPLHA